MKHSIPVELKTSYRLLNHGPTIMVSSAHHGRRNLMSAAWSMPLDFQPPKIAVVIDKTTLTRELVEGSGEFVINLPTVAQAGLAVAVGHGSGRDQDKFERYGIETLPASIVGAPMIAGCAAWLECKVIAEPHLQSTYDLFIAEVVAAWSDPDCYSNGRWLNTQPEQRTVHYIAGGAFFATGERIDVDLPADA